MEPGWLVVALAAQVLSQVAFAQQQRVLLAALGVRVAGREMLAITYSRSAISMALPAGWSPGASRGAPGTHPAGSRGGPRGYGR